MRPNTQPFKASITNDEMVHSTTHSQSVKIKPEYYLNQLKRIGLTKFTKEVGKTLNQSADKEEIEKSILTDPPPEFSPEVYIESPFRNIVERYLNNTDTNSSLINNPGQVSATNPYIDPLTPSFVKVQAGATAVLPCFINNLGHRQVGLKLLVCQSLKPFNSIFL